MDKTSTVQRSLYYYDLYALCKNEKTEKYTKSYKITQTSHTNKVC